MRRRDFITLLGAPHDRLHLRKNPWSISQRERREVRPDLDHVNYVIHLTASLPSGRLFSLPASRISH
jgi:hypothetical protein